MPTYQQIRTEYHNNYYKTGMVKNIESCWIAEVKRTKFPHYYHGQACNRGSNKSKNCPEIYRAIIIEIVNRLLINK